MEQNWGYPHNLSHEGLRAINQFAEAELGAMIVRGRSGANTTLPLTDTQKARSKGEKEADKKRAAAARQTQEPDQAIAAGVVIDGQRYSSGTCRWATPCGTWKEKGVCLRGVSCYYHHTGIPTHTKSGDPINRCIICGTTGHGSSACTAPGGQLDPDREKTWERYKARKEEAQAKGKGKGKQDGKVKKRQRKRKERRWQRETRQGGCSSICKLQERGSRFPNRSGWP